MNTSYCKLTYTKNCFRIQKYMLEYNWQFIIKLYGYPQNKYQIISMETQNIFSKNCKELSHELKIDGVITHTRASFNNSPPKGINFELIDEDLSSVFVYFFVCTTSWELPRENILI